MKQVLGIWGITFLSVCMANAAVTLENISATQREGTKLVDIRYDVASDATNVVDVAVRLSDGAQDLAATALSGDIGSNIPTGPNKRIVWDAGIDQNNKAAAIQVHLTADDGAAPLNLFTPPCPVPQTGQTNSYIPRDDGDLQSGVPWPEPRFIPLHLLSPGRSLVTDTMTGLMWLWKEDYNSHGELIIGYETTNWHSAVSYAAQEDAGGFSDWRLPTIKELESLKLINYTDYNWIHNYWQPPLWSCTSDAFNTNHAWAFEADKLARKSWSKDNRLFCRALLVRTTQPQSMAPVAATGQSTSYTPNDDGARQTGTPWPSPRFIDDGVMVTDRLTGLMWMKNANIKGKLTFEDALKFCDSFSTGGFNDWRLPTINELDSLIHYGAFAPALTTSHPFMNVQNAYYWSSTSFHDYYTHVFITSFHKGDASFESFGYTESPPQLHYVWPVRGGSVHEGANP